MDATSEGQCKPWRSYRAMCPIVYRAHDTHSGPFSSLFLGRQPSAASVQIFTTVSKNTLCGSSRALCAHTHMIVLAGIAQIEEQLHATPGQISWSLSVFILLQGCIPVVWSAISEIIGRKVLLLSSVISPRGRLHSLAFSESIPGIFIYRSRGCHCSRDRTLHWGPNCDALLTSRWVCTQSFLSG